MIAVQLTDSCYLDSGRLAGSSLPAESWSCEFGGGGEVEEGRWGLYDG